LAFVLGSLSVAFGDVGSSADDSVSLSDPLLLFPLLLDSLSPEVATGLAGEIDSRSPVLAV
jgi:hypothetical protein